MSDRTRGVVVPGAALLVGLPVALLVATGCSGPVDIDTPDLDESDAAACAAFVEALPATLNDEEPREVEPADALGAAYGSPEMTLTCGVPAPEGFDPLVSQCEEANGVGWWAPPEQYDDQEADVTLYAVSYDPVVELTVPGDYRPDGVGSALAALSEAVTGSLENVRDCV